MDTRESTMYRPENSYKGVVWYDHTYMFLSFPTYEIASEFLTNFRELVEEAGDLI